MSITKKKKPNNYVNNPALYQAFVKYQADIKRCELENLLEPKIPDIIGNAILQICDKLSNKGNFINYSYKDEMIADGIESCVNAVKSFNTERTENPFAFFTQTAWWAFLRRIEKEKKQAVIKHKNFINSNMENELVDEFGHGYYNSELSNSLIADYDKRQAIIKLKMNKPIGKEKEDIDDE